jgi:tetratricopeptide (TPR) repeat protein
VRLLGDLARLREDRLGDISGALDAWSTPSALDPRDEALLMEIERLAPPPADGAASPASPRTPSRRTPSSARWSRPRSTSAPRGGTEITSTTRARAEERLLAALALEPENAEALRDPRSPAPGRRPRGATSSRRCAAARRSSSTSTARKSMLREAAKVAEEKPRRHGRPGRRHRGRRSWRPTTVTSTRSTRSRGCAGAGAPRRGGRRSSRAARGSPTTRAGGALRREVAELYAGPISDPDRAVQAYRELLDFEPNDLGAREALERLYERAERWRDLEDALRGRLDVAVSAPRSGRPRGCASRPSPRSASRATSRRGRSTSARCSTRRPTHAAAGRELERIYTLEPAGPTSASCSSAAPKTRREGDTAGELAALVRIGELNERELRDPTRAVELYERVLERDPNHVGRPAGLARLAEADGQWERAAEMLRRALSLAPAGADAAALALRLARLEDQRSTTPPRPRASARRALDLDPTHAEAVEWLKAPRAERWRPQPPRFGAGA